MSSRSEVTVTCPKCNNEHPFTMWRSINTQLDPEMRAAVKDRSAFLFECPTCGEKTYVDYGTLYHQMEDKIMIHYANSDENAEEIYNMLKEDDPDGMGMFRSMREENYLIRIVRSQNELREKINIFDAGLDDRIIEIIKLFLVAKYQEDHPGHQSIALYFRQEEDKGIIEIYADNQYAGNYVIPEGFYEDLSKQYEGKIPDMRKDEPFIDRQWAIENLNPDKKKERSAQ
ncbi:MAG: hypothetical protein J5476_01950 [Lachnospiraceae bacterium]|nr:hypothetical protein [Lachnospiraceae bacterium]